MKDENFRVPEKYEMVEISKLIPYANNARTHPDEQIKRIQSSIREFGFINPVIIDKKYNIIAGHGRVIAAEREGIKKIPCLLVEHLTDTQRKAYILADNRLAEMSGWDEKILQVELEGLVDFDVDLEMIGFDDVFDDVNVDDFGEEFELPDGEKPEMVSMSLILHEKQREHIQSIIDGVDLDESYTFGNKQKAGNVVYMVMKQWAELKKYN